MIKLAAGFFLFPKRMPENDAIWFSGILPYKGDRHYRIIFYKEELIYEVLCFGKGIQEWRRDL